MTLVDHMYADVLAFHDKLGIRPRMAVPTPLHRLPGGAGRERVRHQSEETAELTVAHAAGDLAAQADALVDIVYVAIGTAIMMGIDQGAWKEIWDAVQAANISKVPVDGGKQAAKPAGWRDPVEAIQEIIERRRTAQLKEAA